MRGKCGKKKEEKSNIFAPRLLKFGAYGLGRCWHNDTTASLFVLFVCLYSMYVCASVFKYNFRVTFVMQYSDDLVACSAREK